MPSHEETSKFKQSFLISDNLPLLPNRYKVTFVEQPPCETLDWYEDKGMHRMKVSINLDRMIFPDIR